MSESGKMGRSSFVNTRGAEASPKGSTVKLYKIRKTQKLFCNLCGFLHENTHLLDQVLSNNHLVVSNREQSSNCLA